MSDLFSKVVRNSIKNEIEDIHTCLPGRVESYEYEKQRAKVKPLIKKQYKDGLEDPLPVIVSVPVIWPRAGEASLTFPVKQGDGVLLLFSERALERYLAVGRDSAPGDPRKFDLTDAIAIPGLMPFSEDSKAENNEDVLLTYQDTNYRIKPNGDIEIEGAANRTVEITENDELTVKGDGTLTIEGKSDVTIEGESNVTINSNSSVTINSDSSVEISGEANVNVTGNVNLTASKVNIDADTEVTGSFQNSGTADLAGGGPGIAREGDQVEVTVNVTSGSSAGTYSGSGTITSSSSQSTSG